MSYADAGWNDAYKSGYLAGLKSAKNLILNEAFNSFRLGIDTEANNLRILAEKIEKKIQEVPL